MWSTLFLTALVDAGLIEAWPDFDSGSWPTSTNLDCEVIQEVREFAKQGEVWRS
jgi:hypothetical protein